MLKILVTLALGVGLAGCVVAPPGYGYGYPAYGYAPAYYAAPPVGVGVGVRIH